LSPRRKLSFTSDNTTPRHTIMAFRQPCLKSILCILLACVFGLGIVLVRHGIPQYPLSWSTSNARGDTTNLPQPSFRLDENLVGSGAIGSPSLLNEEEVLDMEGDDDGHDHAFGMTHYNALHDGVQSATASVQLLLTESLLGPPAIFGPSEDHGGELYDEEDEIEDSWASSSSDSGDYEARRDFVQPDNSNSQEYEDDVIDRTLVALALKQ
jgi:hypothetical protein